MDAGTGQEIRIFKGHENSVATVAFSPDGARVLTGSWDGTARLWDTIVGKELRAFKGHEGEVMSLAFSPDRARLLTRFLLRLECEFSGFCETLRGGAEP